MPEHRLELEPLHAEFGARAAGVDLSRAPDDETFGQIDRAINRYSMLLFENQSMNDAAQLALTRRFGELEEEHVTYYSKGEITYIGLVGNIDAEGQFRARQRNVAHGQLVSRDSGDVFDSLCLRSAGRGR